MPKDDKVFYKEYESDSGTELPSVDIVEATEVPYKENETEATEVPDKKNEPEAKYGLSKPYRIKIRGKIIHD